jgi:hypothetical protein
MAFSTARSVFSGSCPDAPRWAKQKSFFMARDFYTVCSVQKTIGT